MGGNTQSPRPEPGLLLPPGSRPAAG